MVKYKIEALKGLQNNKMRDLFTQFIDNSVEGTQQVYLKSFYANYGYVSFWYGWLDEEALEKYYRSYANENQLAKIESDRNSENELTRVCFSIKDELHNLGLLFPIVRDHADVIGQGHAEVVLHVLSPDLADTSLGDAINLLRQQANKLEKFRDFNPDEDPLVKSFLEDPPEGGFESVEFDETEEEAEFSATAYEKRVRITFDGDEKLSTVVAKIDKVIEPLKGSVDSLRLYGGLPSYHPF